jgi:anaerobic ribonucleoside-triphosphate reductase
MCNLTIMSVKSIGLRESLTSPDNLEVLRTILASPKPLSLRDIIRNLGPRSKYKYERVKRLSGFYSVFEKHLFNWNEAHAKLKNDEDYVYSLAQKLSSLFGLRWKLKSTKLESQCQVLAEFSTIDNKEIFSISYGSRESISVELKNTNRDYAALTIKKKNNRSDIESAGDVGNVKTETVWIKKVGKEEIGIFKREEYPRSVEYVDTKSPYTRSLEPWEIRESLSKGEGRKLIDDFFRSNELASDYTKYKFTFNIRGFLLYLIGENNSERKDSRRIHKILQNPSLIERFKFLIHWDLFEKEGFDVISNLTRIALELKHVIDLFLYDNECLLQIVTERYFHSMNRFFTYRTNPIYLGLPYSVGSKILQHDTLRKLKEYRLIILNQQKDWLNQQIREKSDLIEWYNNTEYN